MDNATHHGIATCPRNIEGLLAAELSGLGASAVRETRAAVEFEASERVLYEICLWSRLANRVLLRVAAFEADSAEALYAGAARVAWEEHLSPAHTFAVDYTGTAPYITHTQFGALKVKDAIADRFRARSGARPSVDARQPDLKVNVHCQRGSAALAIDLSGESLHRRAYRLRAGDAPLKENLAAAVLLRADWPALAAAGGALVDPMCGAGTLLIEAASMALGIAPGAKRERWGFERWLGHRPSLWRDVLAAAREGGARKYEGVIRGTDIDRRVLRAARENVERAGLAKRIQLAVADVSATRPPEGAAAGLLITNAPYGERVGEEVGLISTYRALGEQLRAHFRGWKAAVLTGNPALGKSMGLRAHKRHALWNGALEASLLLFDVAPERFVRGVAGTGRSAGAAMLENRLRKNARHLGRWARKNEIECFRVYDADLPDFAVAVDVYAGWAHLSEYAPPASIDAEAASRRLHEAVEAVARVLEVPFERIVLKARRRQRGAAQYRKRGATGELLEIREGRARLLVNLHDYLDTGLFLDHRPVRRYLGEAAAGKRFLNLFCYTAAATVHAALGGAAESASVDASRTYLGWAERNLRLNGLDLERHRLLREDCMAWLERARGSYDLILLDPPTFSNSKSRAGILDVERDHPVLIEHAMRLLARDGELVFSTNRRKLALAASVQSSYAVQDATRWSLDEDFSRGRPIHRCWFVRHR